MPHNPFGPICTAACIHVGAAVPNFCAMECFQVPPTRVFARHLCFALFRATSRPGWYRSFTVPTCRSFVLQDRVIDSKIFPQHHTREGGASTDGSGGAQRRSVAGEDSLTAIALYTQQSFLLCSLQNDDSIFVWPGIYYPTPRTVGLGVDVNEAELMKLEYKPGKGNQFLRRTDGSVQNW